MNHRRANFERLLKNLIKNTPRSTLNTVVFNMAKKQLKNYPGLNYNQNKNNSTLRNIINSKGFARQINEAKRLVALTKSKFGSPKRNSPRLSSARLAQARTKAQNMLAKSIKTSTRTVRSPPRKGSIARSIGHSPRRLVF
jgi:hypothetical protein